MRLWGERVASRAFLADHEKSKPLEPGMYIDQHGFGNCSGTALSIGKGVQKSKQGAAEIPLRSALSYAPLRRSPDAQLSVYG